ncbi:MAG: hypothetical protein KBS41_03775, partial [Oscillospiraceae bacterium]|nr:hypothetical protein [Candidatus Equicaccousia limihippi]
LLRNIKIKGFPIFSAICPAFFNGILVGLLTAVFTPAQSGGVIGFLIPFALCFASETAVCLILGVPLYFAFQKIFSNKISLK